MSKILSAAQGVTSLDPQVTENAVASREAIVRGYAEAGYNVVPGSFEVGGVLVKINDVLLYEASGKAYSGPAGAVAAGTDPTSGGFVDRSVLAVAYTAAEVQQKINAGFKVIEAFVDVINTPIVLGLDVTVRFNGTTRIGMNGNVFTIVTASRVYGNFIIDAGFNPTVGYVDGTFRPAMYLSDYRLAGIYGTIKAATTTPTGRALFLDGNARNGVRGIISWFECDLSLRYIRESCKVEASNPSNIDGRNSYVNNNYIRLAIMGSVDGYIEADFDPSNSEIAGNTIHLDYQTSTGSERIVRIRGTRTKVGGNVWDTDKTLYPSLRSDAVDIGGKMNVVGGNMWPSPSSNVVVITDTLCEYTGYTGGTARKTVKPLYVFSRLGLDNGNGMEGPPVAHLDALPVPVEVPASSTNLLVFGRTFGFAASNAPYYVDGYVILTNNTAAVSNSTVLVGIGSGRAARSQNIALAAGASAKVDFAMILAAASQTIVCGAGSFKSADDFSAATTHQANVQISSTEGVTVTGAVFRRSAKL